MNIKMENQKNGKNTFSQRIFTGLKHGWNTPMLPSKVIAFNNYPLVRIFRVIGGLSVLLVLLKKHLLLLLPLQYLILFIAILHISYFVTINLIKVFYGIYKLWRGDLNVRNSPLDRLASLGGNLLYCWKVGCYVASSGISLAGASVVADTILEAGGQEKVFTPLLGKGVKLWVKGKPIDTLFTEINDEIKAINNSRNRFEELRKLAEQCDWSEDKAISKEDYKTIKSALEEVKDMEKSELQARAKILAKKIREYSNDNGK